MADNFDDLQDSVACRLWDDDESVLEVLLRSYAPALEKCLLGKYATALNAEDMEDAVAYAVMKLWEQRSAYDDKKATVFTYIYAIADNKVRDILKNGWSEVLLQNPLDLDNCLAVLAAPPAAAEDQKKSPAQEKLLKDTREAFEQLPDIQRKLLFAKAMAGDGELVSSTLAEEFALPATTVRVYIMRARDAMRVELRRRGHSL